MLSRRYIQQIGALVMSLIFIQPKKRNVRHSSTYISPHCKFVEKIDKYRWRWEFCVPTTNIKENFWVESHATSSPIEIGFLRLEHPVDNGASSLQRQWVPYNLRAVRRQRHLIRREWPVENPPRSKRRVLSFIWIGNAALFRSSGIITMTCRRLTTGRSRSQWNARCWVLVGLITEHSGAMVDAQGNG
jgi:hypothetical protein